MPRHNPFFTPISKAIFLTFLIILTTPTSIHANFHQPPDPTRAAPGQTLTTPQDFPSFFILLTHPDATLLSEIKNRIETGGGRISHTFPRQALIARGDDILQKELAQLPHVAAITTDFLDLAAVDIYGADARNYARVWNSLIQPDTQDSALITAQHPDEPHQDALIAPDIPGSNRLNAAATGVTPGYYQTSEYMAGSVAVGIVLLESNGEKDASTENWTTDEKQHVFSKIVNALNWWAEMEPRANLSFVYDDHFTHPLPTTVEPITRPYYDQRYWIKDAMTKLGYSASSYFTQVRDYNNSLRQIYQTDWAFTIFVVDSSADSDNRFSDSFFAYAYLGGPFMVMTYGNNGYGPGHMDAVAAHEIGHIFLALDQYYTAFQTCTRRSGYLYVENQNSQYGSCNSNEPSIMRGQISPYRAYAIDPYAAGQIGWRDSDGDDILDPLDTTLPVTLNTVQQDTDTVFISGSAQIIPYPSPSRTSVTINTLTHVQYRLNEGPWQPATPTDGKFDSTIETFQFSATLSAGLYRLDVAAFDSAGNVTDEMTTEWLLMADPLEDSLDTQLFPPAPPLVSGQPISVDGLATHLGSGTIAKVEYRLNNSPWNNAAAQDGAFDSRSEAFQVTLTTLPPGAHSLEVFATDSEGNTETNIVSLPLQISEAQQTQIFLPLVTR